MEQEYKLEKYESFLGEVKSDGGHWEKIKKRTATLFQVLMDGDLRELVFVLKHYPQYIEIVCEHFRYLYNYSEQSADIFAASKLLWMSREYHQKQFVRNLIRKLPKFEEKSSKQIKEFFDLLQEEQEHIHPIIIGYYKSQLEHYLENSTMHILQKKILQKSALVLVGDDSYDFSASDRDANLDIPYMM